MSSVVSYLERAAEAGLAGEVCGLPYVADRYDDPFTGVHQVLVEYCAPGLVAPHGRLGALLGSVMERHPLAGRVLLRVAGAGVLPAPWQRRTTYIEYGGGDRQPSAGAVTVRPARAADDPLVHRWLVCAFRNSYPGQVIDPQHAGITSLLSAPGRRSFIAEVAGVPVGHGTVLLGESDEITGEPFAELVDILIDPPEHRRAATGALVSAAAAAGGDLPLRGHVVHPRDGAGGARAGQVLGGLLHAGWHIAHGFWDRDLTAVPAAGGGAADGMRRQC
ncbi:hypothetical protein [Streptomyces sp. NBC_00859]|uniref:hypothetical protein n=1 Tax=Streptomyces sp. NBC_00859 TaxID=2903682 RepID=UPI00386C28A6|nr:hypothetical protein OG584_00375 [Streptomyces sp. NBC_00859]WSZ86724.1 hypothetical protein OG584_34765 [Streptomyces sp. NBC_00859]